MASEGSVFEERLRTANVHLKRLESFWASKDRTPAADTPILEFGCGSGALVYACRSKGYRAFGVDVEDSFASCDTRLGADGLRGGDDAILRVLQRDPYRVPFPDGFFGFLSSHQVLEHVKNLDVVLSETARVLRPGGISVHIFPARWRPLEGHTFVPFAGVIQQEGYLKFWARCGIRNEFQRGLDFRDTAQRNFEYLRSHTSYPPRKQIERLARKHFSKVSYVTDVVLRHSLGRFGAAASLPGASWLCRSFVTVALVLEK